MLGLAKAVGAAIGLAACIAVAVTISCVPDVGVTQYGDWNALRHDNIPGEGGVGIPVVCDGGPAPANACPVSFSKAIYPKMKADGAWKCASTGTCHGAQQAPKIDTTTAQSVIDGLKGYMISGNPHPYINVGNNDPTQSTFVCNITTTNQCGNPMPQSPGTPLTPDEICQIDQWIRCGAPSN
jgi:hypothetical protein